jgi:hypothetical protein
MGQGSYLVQRLSLFRGFAARRGLAGAGLPVRGNCRGLNIRPIRLNADVGSGALREV